MDKLNKIVEMVVEKTVGRFLPEVEAEAGCQDVPAGCCSGPPQQQRYERWCDDEFQFSWCGEEVPHCIN
jgi:hypothetical protein